MSIISEKNNMINLLELQNELNEIVFNYIDTSQKWDKAYSSLDELLNTTIGHFQSSVKKEQINTLTSKTYWVLFLNIVSRLIYFHTISYMGMKGNSSELSKEAVLSLLVHSVKCLPNTKNEDNKEFLEEIKQTVEQLGGQIDEIDKIAQQNNQDPTKCLDAFNEYCQLYK